MITAPIAPVVRRTRLPFFRALFADGMCGCAPLPPAEVLARYERAVSRDEETFLARRARAIPVQQRIVAQCAAIPRHKALVPYAPPLLLPPPQGRNDG
jgi:hypothetical protein